MKSFAIMSILAVVTAAVIADNGLPLTFNLAPNAADQLQPHGLWTPNMTAFAAGKPNIPAGMDLAAEAAKLKASGLDANDIVTVLSEIDNAAAVGGLVVPDGEAHKPAKDCSRCNTCPDGLSLGGVVLL
ncbi:hypothetical protein VM1G_08965 [Cytospora mali]|uniref:Uncharacterized protein n=1 Tax=Cytospora mali TaxID=578113 RepID=A0A194W9M6_CYTMA|nr:hypothetical protein VM1G_08965 [Valsa mali]